MKPAAVIALLFAAGSLPAASGIAAKAVSRPAALLRACSEDQFMDPACFISFVLGVGFAGLLYLIRKPLP